MNKKISVVVPMAGLGKRFSDAGWSLPKPFIDVKGRMMVEHVLDGLKIDNCQLILVMRKDFESQFPACIQTLTSQYGGTPVYTQGVTQGAACTVLTAREHYSDGPLVIADSDTFFQPPVFANFVKDALERQLDISLLTMHSQNPSYSYTKIDDNGAIINIAEKQVISDNAICGAYYFANSALFQNAIMDLMIYGEKVKNEFYMSLVCERCLRQGAHGGIYKVQEEYIHCMGTPEQLNIYLNAN